MDVSEPGVDAADGPSLAVEIAAPGACELSRAAQLTTEPVVFVDGITRTGKSMLGPILSSFERVEIERMEEVIEYVGVLYRLGKLSRDAAVAVLRMETDMHLSNSLLGRNTNFRFGDHSSVWRAPRPWRYFRRLGMAAGEAMKARIRAERPIYQNMTHDQLANFELYHAAFGERLRIVEMLRHPAALVDSWLRRGFGTTRYGEEPLVLSFCIRYQGQDLPYYVLGWEELYRASSPVDRVIRMIGSVWDDTQEAYGALTAAQRRQVVLVPFEDFLQRPFPYVDRMAELLGTRPTRATRAALKRQRCPRTYSAAPRDERQRALAQQASPECRAILERLSHEYEALAKTVR